MSVTDLLPLVGRVAASATEAYRRQMDDAEAWLNELLTGALPRDWCVVCEHRDHPLERHHVAGRHNHDQTVPLCVDCHAQATERQNRWDPRWQLPDNPPALKEAVLILGVADLCESRAHYFGPSYLELSKWLFRKYAELARGSLGDP